MSGDPRVIVVPPLPSRHDLPQIDNFTRINTVAWCSHCDHLFVARVSEDAYGSTDWYRLRWYHLTARRLVKEAHGV